MHKTIRDLLTLALEEDGAYNDITTLSTVAQDSKHGKKSKTALLRAFHQD